MFSAKKHQKPPDSPIFLEILNPGYSKFISGTYKGGNKDIHGEELGPPLPPRPALNQNKSTSTASALQSRQTAFTRRIWLESPRRLGSDLDSINFDSRDAFSAPRTEQRSSLNLESSRTSLDIDGLPNIVKQNQMGFKRVKSNFKGFVFESPWNGRCEFSTIGPTKSLKVLEFIHKSEIIS